MLNFNSSHDNMLLIKINAKTSPNFVELASSQIENEKGEKEKEERKKGRQEENSKRKKKERKKERKKEI